MTINFDPAGPMPLPDGKGDIVLRETAANILLYAAFAVACGAAALASTVYWAGDFARHQVPIIAGPLLATILRYGFLSRFLLPVLLAELLSPPTLMITDAGLGLGRWGVVKSLAWRNIRSINLQLRVFVDRYGLSQGRTFCCVNGDGKRLILRPVFEVAPVVLATYVQQRAQNEGGGKVELTRLGRPGTSSIQLRFWVGWVAGALVVAVALRWFTAG